MDTTQSRKQEEDKRMKRELEEIFSEPNHTRIKKEKWRESPETITTTNGPNQNKKEDQTNHGKKKEAYNNECGCTYVTHGPRAFLYLMIPSWRREMIQNWKLQLRNSCVRGSHRTLDPREGQQVQFQEGLWNKTT